MKRVLLSLLAIVGVLYAAHAFFSANEPAEQTAPAGASSSNATPATIDGAKAPDAAQALSAEAMAPSPAGSRHAIAVEQAPSPSPAESSSGSASSASNEAPPDATPEQAEFMKVTSPASIREGPSTSAAIIGIAQPGAEAQIVSRSTDWVEIIDPGSKKTGWIHESFLAPQEAPASRPVPPEELAALATPESESAADDDQQPSLKSKPRRHASRHWHRRHSIVLGPLILRFR